MRQANLFKGLGIAVVTPFTTEGAVDYEALAALVEDQIAQGTDFLCILGTTAETPCLTTEEKQRIQALVVETNRGRVPLLLGCGSNHTAAVADYLRTADLQGIDGVLLVCPYYNKPTQEGIYQHFKALAAASPLPIVLYNIPGRTGINMTADTTLRLARECDNIVAVKEASGNITQIDEIMAQAPEGFDVLSGDDALTLQLLSAGAAGVISVVGNAYPRQFGQMVHDALDGRTAQALALHRHFGPAFKQLSADGNPAGIKCMLALQGKCADVLRLPLVPAREATREAMRRWMA